MEKQQEFHVLDRVLHNFNTHHICYYNSRAIKFGPTMRPLQGRPRSEERIAHRLMAKKRLLIDEQLIQFKMIIRENQKNTDQLFRERENQEDFARLYKLNQEDLARLNELRCQAQQLLKVFQHHCRQKSLRLQRHERNLSEPKYKHTTIPTTYKRQAYKRLMGFQYLEDNPFYFLRFYKDLQNKIIFCRQIFSLYTNHKEKKISGRTEDLWMQIITCLKEIKKQTSLNEFSTCLMTNDLQQYINPITYEQANQLKMLFEDKCVITKRMLRRRRTGQLMKLAHALDIQVEENHSFDFKNLAQTYRQLTQKFDIRHPIGLLLLVKKIQPIISQNCGSGQCYQVEYYIGLKKLYRCGNHA